MHRLPCGHHGQAPSGRNAERVHRLADDVFPQHRPERGAPVTAPGEPRLSCPFQLDVHAIAGRRDLLTEQDRAAITERGEVTELVTSVRLRDRSSTFREHIAGKHRSAFRALERLRLESKPRRQRPVERDQARLANCRRCRRRVEELRQVRVGVLESPACHGRSSYWRAFEAPSLAPAGERRGTIVGCLPHASPHRRGAFRHSDSPTRCCPP